MGVVVLHDNNKEFEMHVPSVFSLSQHVLYECWKTCFGIWYLTDGDGTVHRLAAARRLMLGGDAYRVPSNIHFHIACITYSCMPSRYTLKTIPRKLPSPSICSYTSDITECNTHNLDHHAAAQNSVFRKPC
jgi:hypothetical protein